jgi:large subunit ribosomal protein L13
LPDGPLAKKQLTKLKMYCGEKHPHSSQNPIEINFSKINKKNYIEH